jgi:hypothetical protein
MPQVERTEPLDCTARKEEQLGMSFGSACNRLRNSIMFDLVCSAGRNICFRCGQRIVSASDLSIDHKEPWLGVDVCLFWNLNNIAFSHRSCNTDARRRSGNPEGGRINRKIGPKGTAWCAGHKDFVSLDMFSNNKRNWNDVETYCKDCRKTVRAVA